MSLRALAMIAIAAALVCTDTALAQGDKEELGEIATKLNNPLGSLWMINVENDVARYRGFPVDGSKWVNTTIIQPVMPIPLTEKWNLINRPIIPFITAPKLSGAPRDFTQCPGNCQPGKFPPGPSVSSSRENGWGDIVFWSMISPSQPPKLPDGSSFVWGVGPSFQFPTATEDQFGSNKWSFGPSAVALRLPAPEQKLTLGLFQQHHFGTRGSGDQNVSRSQFQPIYWYKLPWGQWQIGGTPIININWKASNDNKITLPLELSISNTIRIGGKLPVRFGVGASLSVVAPDDYGQRWMLKFFVVPVIPSLIDKPILGRLFGDG